MKKLLLLALTLTTYIGFSQCMDPVLTDFECGTPSHPFTGGTTVTNIANPFPGGINTSANVGEALDDGTQAFDALIVDYGGPIDLATNPIFHIKVYTQLTTPIPLVAKVEGGSQPLEIATTIDNSNQWTEYTFDFSSVANEGNTTLVIFFNFGQSDGTATDTYYIDDMFFGPGTTMCADPILTDFECDMPSHPFTGGTAVTNIANPFPGGINTSGNVGEAVDDGTQPFDALIVNYGGPIDLATNPIFHMKVYTELTTPIPLVAKVEGGSQPLEVAATINDANQWVEYTFDFSSVADEGNTTLVIFFNFAQSDGTTTDTYYIDDLFFGPAPTMCNDPILTDFECDIPSHPFTGGTTVENIANPFSGGINTSGNVGEATDDGTQGFDALIVNYGGPIDLATNPIFHIKVYTELTTPIPIVAKVEGGSQALEIQTNIDVSNQWKEYTFDFSSVANEGNTTLVIFFNFAQTDGTTTDTYYIDDLFFSDSVGTTFTYTDDATGWSPNDPSDVVNPSTSADDIVVQSGTATIMNNVMANTINVASGATLNTQGIEITTSITSDGAINIFGVLTPNTAQINANGNLTFKSTASGTAAIADASNATIVGNIDVERYIPASNRAYRLLSTSVQNAGAISSNWQQDTHITGAGGSANGFDETGTNNPSMFTVNEQALPAAYQAITSTNSTNLMHGTGYLTYIRGDRTINLTDNDATPTETTLSSTGTLFQGVQTLGTSELNTGDFQAGGVGASLIANPYQAPVNMEQVLNSSTQINQEFIHVYDPTLGDRGAFVTVGFGAAADGSNDDTNFTFGPNMGTDASPTNATRFLQPGSAIFVNTIDPGTDGTATPSLTFNEIDKAINSGSLAPFKMNTTNSVASGTARINMALYDNLALANNETPRDGLTIRFSDQYSNAVDMMDAYKASNLDENFASKLNGKNFSIQSRNLPLIDEVVDLSINSFTTTDYTFRANLNGFEDVEVYLVDDYLGTETLLENDAETLVQFSVDSNVAASISEDRFSLTFKQEALSTNKAKISDFTLYPNPVKDGKVYIQMNEVESTSAKVSIISLLGNIVSEKNVNLSNPQPSIDVSVLSKGVYIIQLNADGNISNQRIIIQ